MQYRERKIRKNRELAHPAQDSPEIPEKKSNIRTQKYAGEVITGAEETSTVALAPEPAIKPTEKTNWPNKIANWLIGK